LPAETPRVRPQQGPPTWVPQKQEPAPVVQTIRRNLAGVTPSDTVAAQAERIVHHGMVLARRGASYAARAEFISALGLIAETLDARERTAVHSRSLADGLRALREADDFVSSGSRLAADLDMKAILAAHSTPVLKDLRVLGITPLMARQRYCEYAWQRLSRAGGNLPPASQALFGLGRIYALSYEDSSPRWNNAFKAMVAYQAALSIDRRNYLAANELGVLMARQGQLEEAREALRTAVDVCPRAETWHNLCVVHSQLGEVELAQSALEQLKFASAPLSRSARNPSVFWLGAERFGQNVSDLDLGAEPAPAASSPAGRSGRPPGASWWGRGDASPASAPADSVPPASEPRQVGWSGSFPAGRDLPTGDADHGAGGYPPRVVQVDPGCGYAVAPRGPGQYIGPPRRVHVPEYRLRVDDSLEFVYRFTREESPVQYRLNVGDVIVVESVTDPAINRGGISQGQGLVIQPDGSITLPMIGQIRAAQLSVEELRKALTEQYNRFIREPEITVTPLRVNSKLEDLRSAVDSRYGAGGQSRRARVTPEGTVQLPALGSVPAHGLTLDELKYEVDERYGDIFQGGVEVTPILTERAERYLYVLGEVRLPGRYTMEGPTTVTQAIALGGGWNVGGDIRQVVVFRRTDDWQLAATKLNVRQALLGKSPRLVQDIWLRDSDVVLVPKTGIRRANELIEQVFTRGLYGVIPLTYGYDLAAASIL
jgi:polysaccharide export outer membrane protein